MPRKCSVIHCKTNYELEEHKQTPVYRFPLDPTKKSEWIVKLPQNMKKKKITRNMTVCAKHFAPDISYRKAGRFWIPDEPPTLFDVGGKSSLLPTHTPRKRKTEKTTALSRAPHPDEQL